MPRRALAAVLPALSAAMLVGLSGCGPVRLVASTNIPPPLVVKLPIAIALFVPPEFSGYVHKEERWSTDWNVELGKAQTDGITRLMSALFERVVPVDSVNAGTQLGTSIVAILEPSIEEYAFVTPRDAGSPFYAVSIKYRVNVYMPDGKLADSWGFTGYGTAPSQGVSSGPPLEAATALAMRDAGAKLAVEFREQAVVRGLLPGSESVDAPPPPAAPASGESTAPAPAPPANGQSNGKEPSEPEDSEEDSEEPEKDPEKSNGTGAPPPIKPAISTATS